MKWFLYILKSKVCEKYYAGISQDPERRLVFHNTVEKSFTSRYKPLEIVFIKECESKKEALIFEKKVKGWKSRLMIEKVLKVKHRLNFLLRCL